MVKLTCINLTVALWLFVGSLSDDPICRGGPLWPPLVAKQYEIVAKQYEKGAPTEGRPYKLGYRYVGMSAGQERIESVYSDLASNKCVTLTTDRETGASTQRCPGIAGYKLLVHDDDSRQSITVVTPDGKKHDLNFWDVVTHGFSSLGNKAEWRVIRNKRKLVPIALIVRVNASEDAEDPNRKTSYLAVTKLTPNEICVTHKISQSADANAAVRRYADENRTAACLKE